MFDLIFAFIVVCIVMLFTFFMSLVCNDKTGSAAPIPVPICFDDLHERRQYDPKLKVGTKKHIGQRKLLMNEVQFLTPITDKAVVIYAGSAPSNKGAFLASLFPKLRWIFIDPNPFDIRPHIDVTINDITAHKDRAKECIKSVRDHTITIINDLMTIDLATALGKAFPDCYFISDIRTNMTGGEPTDADMIWNLAQQYNWIQELKPMRSMLKFRHPFYDQPRDEFDREIATAGNDLKHALAYASAIDFVSNYKARKLVYPRGKIMLQPWAPGTSAETRLVIEQSDLATAHDYGDGKEYEEKMFHLNTEIRQRARFHHDTHGNGIDACFDCALEVAIWHDYVSAHGGNVQKLIAQTNKITSRDLKKYKHSH
jgi:Poly A polymerase regulatory subunit